MRRRSTVLIALGVALACVATPAMSSCLTMPSPYNVITSIFGYRYHPKYAKWRLHAGTDLRAPMGTQLVATHAGTVQLSHSAGGGNEVRIIGTNGVATRYLHLSRASVRPGTQVTAGQPVAISGNTGHSTTAPHLHLEVYGAGGKLQNPEPLLCPRPSRTADAAISRGRPIRGCDPQSGNCSGPGLPPARPGEIPVGGDPTATTSVDSMPPAPRMSEWDDMSVRELLATEVMRRHGNPDWRRELGQRTERALLIELADMLAVRALARYYIRDSKERVEQMLAAKVARRARTDLAPRLQRQREAAGKGVGSAAKRTNASRR